MWNVVRGDEYLASGRERVEAADGYIPRLRTYGTQECEILSKCPSVV